MRRWLIAFLALIMVTQLSWAAVGVCCLKEISGKSTTTEISAKSTVFKPANASLQADSAHAGDVSDCHCHHTYVATVSIEPYDIGNAVRPAFDISPSEMGKSNIPDGLERPNWLRA